MDSLSFENLFTQDLPAAGDSTANAGFRGIIGDPVPGTGIEDNIASVLGSSSRLSDGYPLEPTVSADMTYLADTLTFKVLVIAIFISYFYILNRYRPQVYSSFRVIKGNVFTEKMIDKQSSLFDSFLKAVTWTGIIFMGMIVIRYLDFLSLNVFAQKSGLLRIAAPVISAAAVFIIWIFRLSILKFAGGLTLHTEFTGHIINLSKILFALVTIIVIPVFLLVAVNGIIAVDFILVLLAALAAGLIVFSIYRTFALFIEQKISILSWILYLCTVEIFPVTLFIFAALKYIL